MLDDLTFSHIGDEFISFVLGLFNELKKISNEISFFAPESKQILFDWINSISIDWVLSRRRYYGTEVPLWYCKKCNFVYVPEPGKYYQPWKESPPIKKCPKCNGTEFRGEDRTFDTWFDSSSSEAYILGYLWDKEFFKKHLPCGMRPQGKEIVRNWLYYTVLKSFHLYNKAPFKDAWIHMHIVDEKGEKMSKSLGNVVDPQEILKKYGAEAFRIWSVLEGDITRGDIRCSFERIEGSSKFLTKLWNITRFISGFPDSEQNKLCESDKWILSELGVLIKRVRKDYEEYAFSDAANAIRNFVWNLFASHYIEMVKTRAYGEGFNEKEQEAAWHTLHIILRTVLKLLAPLTPFITDYIWGELYGKESVHLEEFPQAEWDFKLEGLTDNLIQFNTDVWKTKKDKNLSLKAEIQVEIPKDLIILEKDLKRMHNIR